MTSSTTRNRITVEPDLQEFEVDLHEAVMNSIGGRAVGILAPPGAADDRRFGMIIEARPTPSPLADPGIHAR